MRHMTMLFSVVISVLLISACMPTLPTSQGAPQADAQVPTETPVDAQAPETAPLLPTIPMQNPSGTGIPGQSPPSAGVLGQSPLGGTTGQPGAPDQQTEAMTDPTTEPAQTFTVKRGTIEDILVLEGQIAPVQYNLKFTQDGFVKALYVQSGQSVEAGQLLAELDQGDLSSQFRQAQLDLQQSQALLNRQIQAGKLEVQQAQLDVDAARSELEEAKSPPSALDIAEAQTAIREAQADLETVRNDTSQAKNLAHQDMVYAVIDLDTARQRLEEKTKRAKNPDTRELTRAEVLAIIEAGRQEVEAAQLAVRQAEERVNRTTIAFDTARNNEVAAIQNAEAAVAVAQARLDDLLKGNTSFEIADLELAVRRAELQLAQVEQSTAPDPSLITAVDANRLQIQEINSQIEARRIYAPFSGDIAAVHVAPALPVQIGSPVITLVDRSRLEIIAANDEGRGIATRISAGQPAEIYFSRYGGQRFSGSISYVPNLVDPSNTDTNYHITFEPDNREFSVGDLAEVRITLGRRYEALWLPVEAVRFTRDRSSVTIRDGEETERVEVVTGIVTSDKVEIISGLQEGDVVIVE